MIAIEDRRYAPSRWESMSPDDRYERFEVASADSSLTFFATSSLFPVYGKAGDLNGYVEAVWRDGALAIDPKPKMYVEFKVENLRTGNDLKDREMWKLIESKRFPKVAGELREIGTGALPGRYAAAGQITLAGLARRYDGELLPTRAGDVVRVAGDINVDVRDFGLRSMSLLVLSVEPLVRVRLRLVARKVQ
ncbi:MAG TPA: YceI family protein [Candidatus Tumulicola sp.]|nr:YceI family protein [Candidatus Tumulicola sp.]